MAHSVGRRHQGGARRTTRRARLRCHCKDTQRPYGPTEWWCYVSKAGEQVLEPTYNQAMLFRNGLAWVHVGDEMYQWESHEPPVWVEGYRRLIHRTGKIVWEQADPPPPGTGGTSLAP